MAASTVRVSLVDFDADAHKLLLADWLKHPHARLWWGDPAENLHEAVSPEPGLGQSLIQVKQRPVGYMRWQRLSHARIASIRILDPPEGVVDIDVLIGDPRARGQGLAAKALRRLARRLFADSTVNMLVMCMSIENNPGVRAAEKAGFKRTTQYEDAEWGPCWVLARRRPEGTTGARRRAT